MRIEEHFNCDDQPQKRVHTTLSIESWRLGRKTAKPFDAELSYSRSPPLASLSRLPPLLEPCSKRDRIDRK